MTAEALVFWVLAVVTVGSAAVVVLSRTLIYSACALLFTFFGVAGLYVLLGADFLAATQIFIYVGGILILILFGVMLTHRIYDLDLKSELGGPWDWVAPASVAIGLFVILSATALRTQWLGSARPPAPTTGDIGRLFLGKFLLPFEAASVLLLVALVGAAMIVRRRRDA